VLDCSGVQTGTCGNGSATPDQLFSGFANVVAKCFNLAYQSPPPITDAQIRTRMTFNSGMYRNGNGGHDFTKSLSDDDRLAIIEYLKTL